MEVTQAPTRYCVRCKGFARLSACYCPHCGARMVDFVPGTTLGPEGRYRIEVLLGGGGFGLVYRAFDQLLRRPCVVKQLVVPDVGYDAAELQRIQANLEREALLLASLNNPGHPNIPEIYEYLPTHQCLVMKFIEGQSLQQLLHQGDKPLPVEVALRYGRDLATALVYIHARTDAKGNPAPVLHRDLKPDNVLLDTTGRVWLIDFGLAQAFQPAREPRQSAEQSGGTPGYAPPEQWRGQAEPGSDVYGLAATLYALLTNRRPILPQVLHSAEGVRWVPMRQFNPEIRGEVEQLIQQAMSIEPAARPTAVALQASLEAMLTRLAIPDAFLPDQPPEVPLFIGRETDLSRAAERLRQQHLVVVAGLAGVGKTGLAVMLARQMGDPAKTFWHCFLPDEQVDRCIRNLAGFLARQNQPELLRVLQQTGQETTLLSFTQICDYLLDHLHGRGYVLCFDDVQVLEGNDQRASQFRQLVQRLRGATQAGQLDMIVTSRRTPTWVQSGDTLTLTGVSAAGARQLLAQHGLQLTAELQDQLYARTEGNLKLLHLASDLLRHASNPEDLIDGLEQTDDIANYLVREIDRNLSHEERTVMGVVAALLGYSGTREALEELLETADLRALLINLRERYLLTVTPSALGPQYGEHAIVRAFYYQSLGRKRRRELHRRAGDYYAEVEVNHLRAIRQFLVADAAPQAAQIATTNLQTLINAGEAPSLHHLLAQLKPEQLDPTTWSAVCTAAGEVAALLGDYEAARPHLQRALQAGATLAATSSEVEAQVRRRRLLALIGERTGRYDQAEADCRNGLTLALNLDLPNVETARLYTQLAEILWRRSQFEAATEACAEGLAALPPAPANPGERAALCQRFAMIDGFRGHYAAAIAGLERSLILAQQAADPLLSAAIQHNLGVYLNRTGMRAQALASYSESLRLKEQIGDLAGKVQTLNNVGGILLEQGAYAEATVHLEAARTLSLRLNMPEPLYCALLNLGNIALAQGQTAAAVDAFLAAQAIVATLADPYANLDCLYRLGEAALAQGKPLDAQAYGEQCLTQAQAIGSAAYVSCALRVLGEAALAQGEIEQATGLIEQAWLTQRQVGDPYDQALTLAAQARLALAQGNRSQATARIEAGLVLARQHQAAYPLACLEQLQTALADPDPNFVSPAT